MDKNQTTSTAKKGLFRIIFSRTGIILLLLLFQIGLIIEAIRDLEEYITFIYGALLI